MTDAERDGAPGGADDAAPQGDGSAVPRGEGDATAPEGRSGGATASQGEPGGVAVPRSGADTSLGGDEDTVPPGPSGGAAGTGGIPLPRTGANAAQDVGADTVPQTYSGEGADPGTGGNASHEGDGGDDTAPSARSGGAADAGRIPLPRTGANTAHDVGAGTARPGPSGGTVDAADTGGAEGAALDAVPRTGADTPLGGDQDTVPPGPSGGAADTGGAEGAALDAVPRPGADTPLGGDEDTVPPGPSGGAALPGTGTGVAHDAGRGTARPGPSGGAVDTGGGHHTVSAAISRNPQPALHPLDHSDPYRAADAVGVDNLLRCWVRETGAVPGADGVLRIRLGTGGAVLRTRVTYWSEAGHHRFGPVAVEPADPDAPALDSVTLACLLAREAGTGSAETADLAARVADSVRHTARFLGERRTHPGPPPGTTPFLDGEQALLTGHPLHPAPKSRQGLRDGEVARFSPESRGSFPLHWLAVHRSVAAGDSGWTERGRPVPADLLTARLAGPGLALPPDTVALPLHPWQAADLADRPAVRRLLDAGLLHDLGPHGEPWHPTSSVRTVYRADAPAMLKLSLGLRITNSRRENLRKELWRGAEVHRLLRGGLARQWHAVHPRFDIVRDPAWLAVDDPDGHPVPGLDVVLRHNAVGPGADIVCVAGLTAPRPTGPGRPACSRLAGLLGRLTARTGRPAAAVAVEWFLRYLEAVVRPVLWLDGEAGVALEAHQQNTLVELDGDGWPVGGRYRDNQGYYFRESHRAGLTARLPEIGRRSETFVADPVADERFGYYLGVNNVLGLIGALGAERLADERLLLAACRRFLADAAATGRSALPDHLLSSPTLRCKANLLTRLHGLDELVGPVDTQSVYVTVPNPLATPVA
ncbi:rhizobactin siderophore biosynthesis protein rhbC [Streptantibioticus cattleyicolor NRRL 8057 = DSM 46488]|uniref:Rhizobactin siderophore biosynthesis protein rhbC n=1 Tax=Streptantibioticus cattleyicolor (strain ATCC 35852 / DSM 46488 / JCM 4925 / NBRC 14057 / NRRL 8057) TaxID=1003195 RepID=G8X0L7_STREN|nr:rhizobactin siderophore biosynthesis protein rhbC [Streptantibioticus cattleyicolor NRRL 8057 = DSM 46488]